MHRRRPAPPGAALPAQEDPLARAKRTDRTEARRRYRAEQAGLTDTDDLEEAPDDAPSRSSARPAAPKPGGRSDAPRPSLTGALRGSFQPLDLRGDLLALPTVLRHWAVLVAVAGAVGAAALFIVSTNDLGTSLDFSLSDPLAGKQIGTLSNISYLVVSLFVAPPPAAGAFLIGFTARRASWLGGLVYGVVASICYSAILLSPAGRLLTAGNPTDVYIANAALLGPAGALLFAGAAAWYKRFLNLANPNRGKRPARPANGKGRTRTAAAKSSNRAR